MQAFATEQPTAGRVKAPERRRNALVGALFVTTWLWVVAPRVLQSLGAPKLRTQAGVAGPPTTHLASQAQMLLTFATLGICIYILLDGIKRPPPQRLGRLVVLLLPWLYLVTRDLYEATKPTTSTYVYVAIALACWVLHPPVRSLRWLGYLTAAAAAISIVMAITKPDSAIFRSLTGQVITEDKQILPIGLLAGFFTQPNNLGQMLVIGLPAISLIERRSIRRISFCLTGFALIWTASRSSIYTAGMILVVATAVGLARPANRRTISRLLLSGIAFVVATLPFLTANPEAYTNRGQIWRLSLLAWHENEPFGLGSTWYARVASTSGNLGYTVFHGHNQAIQLLVTGGMVLLALAALMLGAIATAVTRLAGRDQIVATCYLAALLGACLLEVSLVYVDNHALMFSVALPCSILMFADRAGNPLRKGSAT